MKTFLLTFAAVLAAGLVLFGVVKWDRAQDRKAAEWEAKAADAVAMAQKILAASSDSQDLKELQVIVSIHQRIVDERPAGAHVSTLAYWVVQEKKLLAAETAKLSAPPPHPPPPGSLVRKENGHEVIYLPSQ